MFPHEIKSAVRTPTLGNVKRKNRSLLRKLRAITRNKATLIEMAAQNILLRTIIYEASLPMDRRDFEDRVAMKVNQLRNPHHDCSDHNHGD